MTCRPAATVLVFVVLSLSLTTGSRAAAIAIGKVCLDGVSEAPVPDSSHKEGKGVWTHFVYSVEGSGGQPAPRLVVFAKPFALRRSETSCAELADLETSRQNKPILNGRIDSLRMTARVFTSNGDNSNRLQVDPNDLHVTVSEVSSAPRPAHGGTVDLRGGQSLVLTNDTGILTDNSSGAGHLEIATSGFSIVNARIALPGGANTVVTLVPDQAQTAETFGMDLLDGRLSLITGSLSGTPSTHLKGDRVDTGSVRIEAPDLGVKGVEVTADRSSATLLIRDLNGRANQVMAGSSDLSYALTAPRINAQQVSGDVQRKPNEIYVPNPNIVSFLAASDVAQVNGTDTNPILTGGTTLDIGKATRTTLDATSSWPKPNLPAADFLFPATTLAKAQWNLSGALSALHVSGNLDSTVQHLEYWTARAPARISFNRVVVTNEIDIPINIDWHGTSGSIDVADRDQHGVLTGALRRCRLTGTLMLDLHDIKQTRAEFPAGNVEAGVDAMIATSPFVAGTKPVFASVGVGATNRTALSIGAKRAGLVDITTETLTLGEPIIRIGQGGSQVRASLELNSQGKVTLTSDISDGSILLTQGAFDARGTDGGNAIEFHLLESGKWIDIGGTRVVDPVVKVKALSVNVDKTKAVTIGTGEVTGLSISATSIIKDPDPTRPTEISYHGSLVDPFTIDDFSAAHVDITDVLVIEGAALHTLNLHIANAEVNFGSDMSVSNGDLRLTANNLQEIKVDDTQLRYVEKLHLDVSGNVHPGKALGVNNDPGVHVDIVVTGRSDQLAGDGSAHIGGFSGYKETEFSTGFKCENGSTLEAPFEFNFAIGESSLAAHYREGHFSGEGRVGPFGLIAHSKEHSQCDGHKEHYVLVPAHKAWTDGICSKGFEVYQCHWEINIPEVAIDWHAHADVFFGATTLTMTTPVVRLGDGKVDVCNEGAVAMPASAVVMGVSPQIDSPYPHAFDIINLGLRATFVGAESLAGTTLANGVGWTASAIGTPLGNLKCIR